MNNPSSPANPQAKDPRLFTVKLIEFQVRAGTDSQQMQVYCIMEGVELTLLSLVLKACMLIPPGILRSAMSRSELQKDWMGTSLQGQILGCKVLAFLAVQVPAGPCSTAPQGFKSSLGLRLRLRSGI